MIGTYVVLVVFFVVDLFVLGRRPHVPSTKECVQHIAFFVAMALVFGGLIWWVAGAKPAVEFYSGWLTEYSLSIDNLFVFVIFGAFLIYTAVKVAIGEDDDEEFHENGLIRLMRRFSHITNEYDGERLRTTIDGRKYWTPMLIVFITIGTTDVMFAFDSIPAIFGLTKDPFIVFTSNVFALLGLQQLYFLLGRLLDKLVYLPVGLSLVLGFIGVKLILEALHGNTLPFINHGQPLGMVPEVPTWLSLVVIIVCIGGSALASVIKMKSIDAKQAAAPSDSQERP